jgi:hypothetical protein
MKDRHFRCGSLRILLLLCLIVSTQTTIQADIVKGRVVDAETGGPMEGATVKLTQRYGDYGTMINSLKPTHWAASASLPAGAAASNSLCWATTRSRSPC